jgi:predicted dehydrogenase
VLRLGLIGLGWIGRTHAATIGELPAAELVATADPVADGATHRDWRALLGEELDAVLVCTPPDLHREPTLAVLDRGLPVYLEKPIAHDRADARAIVAAAAQPGARCVVGYQYRALSFLDRLPRDSTVVLGVGLSETMDRPWLGDRSRGGSFILERASHLIDLIRVVAGSVERIVAVEREATLALTMELASGALASIVVGRSGRGPGWRLELVGPAGATVVRLDDPASASGPALRVDDEDAPLLGRALGLFCRAVGSGDGAAVLCSPADALETLEVALAAERSRLSGRMEAVER